jgi:RNA polymerase sigma-70 factor (ECF subfamily)
MDASLVARARDGDPVAFDQLVADTGDRCYAIAVRVLRHTEYAEDAVQQAFLLAWRDLPTLRDLDRFEPWLFRLVVNAAHEEARRTRRWIGRIRPLFDEHPELRDATADVDRRDALERAFVHLSIEQRVAVVLRYYVGLPQDSIADIQGVPVGTVKSRLHAATRVLRRALGGDAEDTEPVERAVKSA